MIWSTIEPGLITVFQSLGASDVGWEEKESRWREGTCVKLTSFGLRGIGRPEQRLGAPDVDGAMAETMYQPAVWTVQVNVETQNQSLANSAWALTERLRLGLHSEAATASLAALELGVSLITPTTRAAYRDSSGRMRSVAVFDVLFNVAMILETGDINAVLTTVIEGEGLTVTTTDA